MRSERSNKWWLAHVAGATDAVIGAGLDPSKRSPTRETVASLQERVEKLDGPSRDADFWLGVHLWSPDDRGNTDAEYQADIDYLGIDAMVIEGPFTASLDWAVALADRVLPGHAVAVGTMFPGHTPPPWATIWNPHGFIIGNRQAPTPALALCRAILRAIVATPI